MNCPHCSTVNPDTAESCSRCGTPMPVGEAETIQMVDTSALAPGSDFGPRYRIESLLGQGGMGRVYKAYDKDLDRVVALKVVRHGVMGETDALRRFKQELVLASKISHKNILRIHDMGEVGDTKFITMAYVEGHDLYGILRDNPKLPLERVMKFSTQLAEALAAAHAEGVVHRDLKPHNILVNKDDQIFISDFGLAKSFEEGAIGMTRTGAFLGTPRYMSPEQVEGKPADQRSDLYAYGLILYEMVTGDVPFTGETTLKVMYQRIQEKPKSPKLVNPDLPNWLVRIIMRCLEKDPAHRYQSAYEILADLQGGRSGSSVVGRTVQIEIPEFANRRWIWAVGGSVLLVALAFAIPPVRHLILGGKAGGGISGIPPISEGKFVAIMPFRVLGDEQSLGYIAEGLNEALSSKLFQLKEVKLASDAAVAKISDKDPLEKIARNLGANLIVQGVIQGSSDRMAVIVNLMDPLEGKKVWTKEFTGGAKDLLSIEDQISSNLVTALNVKASSEEMARAAERPTDNVDAYDLYLRGRQAMRGSDLVKGAQTAIGNFEEVIKKDPSFALAYSGLADASLTMYTEKKDPFWAQKALSAAQRAEQLKDNIPEVHFSIGSAYARTGHIAEAIAEFKRGVELAPNSDVGYARLGKVYLENGQKEEAVVAYKKAIEVNPYYWAHHIELGNAYFGMGKIQEAIEEYKRVTELEPDSTGGWEDLGNAYEALGKTDDSIAAYKKSIALAPTWDAYSNLGNIYFMTKRYPEAVAAFEKATELGPGQEVAMGNLADAYRASGQKDKAMAAYDKAIALAFQDLQVNSKNTSAMADLALYYAKKGDAKHAREFIDRARGIDKKDMTLAYTEALVENLAGDQGPALRTLRDAFSKGYSVKDAQADPDLANLQNNPEFQAMVKQFSHEGK